ncbi:MAG: DNA replication/repair protein RecF [Deltaproteobacteria bacterium]|nr:MAG: DNA replication/repair protein RecF [Deltaproteobacteria bacterium]
MRLTALELSRWRNVARASLSCDSRFVVLHGDNGQGKTNVLEAVWVLATLRSFRESRPRRLVQHGADIATIRAVSSGPAGTRRLQWRLEGGQRNLRVDGGPPTSLLAWFELVRAVLFVPEHQSIVRGEPAARRAFIDRAAFTARPAFLDHARDYRRVLRQKAALLRSGRADVARLRAWDEQLAALGARVAVARWQVLQELQEPFRTMHARIAGKGEEAGHVRLAMRSLGGEEAGVDEVHRRLAAALAAHREDELRRGRVLVGPHRDDVLIELNGRLARHYASQGQARSIVLALKLAELDAARARGEAPMLLVDDLTSELDRGRMERFVEVLAGLDNQVWMTTTDPAWLGPLPGENAIRVRVVGGTLKATSG